MAPRERETSEGADEAGECRACPPRRGQAAGLQACEREAERIIAAMLKAGYEGDWRAFESLISRVHGRPTEKVETRDVRQVEGLSLGEPQALRARLLREPGASASHASRRQTRRDLSQPERR